MSSRFVAGAQPPPEASPDPVWIVVGARGVWVAAGEGGAARLPRAAELAGAACDERHYLGRLDGEDVYALGAAADAAPPAGVAERSLRSLYLAVDELRFALAGRAVQIVDWDRTHRHCGRCAAATEVAGDERARVCPRCGLKAFPRVAPAAIVLVHREERALLARAANFPLPFYSALAGFVEPGESIEECVAREIREEVGVEVTRLRYFGSQPWPFPHSLMIAFHADWAGGEIAIDDREIADAGWFDVDHLPPLPTGISIARRLIDDWIAARRRGEPGVNR
jgi:NAD+ diphosphatase